MADLDILANLSSKVSSKDAQVHMEVINNLKQLLKNFDVANEYILINSISYLLEVGSDKTLQPIVEDIFENYIVLINPYAFESVFQEISKVFTSVKFQSKVLGLKMIGEYAKLHPNVVASNLYLITETLINLYSEIK